MADAAWAHPVWARFGAIRGYSQCMYARALRPASWLLPVGAALIYLTSLSAILVEESEEPRLLVVAALGLSLLAGLVIKGFSALVLPLGVIALTLLWVPHIDEDAVVAMVGGLLGGVVLARGYERLQRVEVAEPAGQPRAHRWPALRRAVRTIVTREGIDDVIDHLRFRLDTFPHGVYHPVAALPVGSATRGAGSESRWEAMFPVLCEQRVESAVDVGACEGYFSIRLGRACIPTVAIEGDPSSYRTALFAVRRNELDDVGVLALELTPENVVSVPASDCTLCLSVWHHFVRDHGLGAASGMLETIWSRTGKVLFFDSGEDEMTPDFDLPAMMPDSRSWLAAYLAETCSGSRIEYLGRHQASDPEGRPCERNLFAVIRV
jgi:hypothetical protein